MPSGAKRGKGSSDCICEHTDGTNEPHPTKDVSDPRHSAPVAPEGNARGAADRRTVVRSIEIGEQRLPGWRASKVLKHQLVTGVHKKETAIRLSSDVYFLLRSIESSPNEILCSEGA
jgi:hypothetical protein